MPYFFEPIADFTELLMPVRLVDGNSEAEKDPMLKEAIQ